MSQKPFQCKLDWGAGGAARASRRAEIVVIVDTLSFSTAVANAVSRGGIIYPCGDGDDRFRIAETIGGEASVHRSEVPSLGRFSLSPSSFDTLESGTKVALWSPNGAQCCRSAASAPAVLLGAFANASAVARIVSEIMLKKCLAVTVVPCGERIPLGRNQFGEMRIAIEDYLAAGCILSQLDGQMSPEASVSVTAFNGSKSSLEQLVLDSVSGREARRGGFESDVRFACRLNSIDAVPIMRDGAFVSY